MDAVSTLSARNMAPMGQTTTWPHCGTAAQQCVHDMLHDAFRVQQQQQQQRYVPCNKGVAEQSQLCWLPSKACGPKTSPTVMARGTWVMLLFLLHYLFQLSPLQDKCSMTAARPCVLIQRRCLTWCACNPNTVSNGDNYYQHGPTWACTLRARSNADVAILQAVIQQA